MPSIDLTSSVDALEPLVIANRIVPAKDHAPTNRDSPIIDCRKRLSGFMLWKRLKVDSAAAPSVTNVREKLAVSACCI